MPVLTVINNKVIFNYSSINASTRVTNPDFIKASQAREFLYKTTCDWEATDKPQVMKMVYDKNDFADILQSAVTLKSYLCNCEAIASYLKYIEVTKEFEAFLHSVEDDCKRFWEIKISEQAKLKAQDKWTRLCKSGCGNCPNLCYLLDQPVCKASGDELIERHKPQYKGGTLFLFQLVPFPSQNCVFNR